MSASKRLALALIVAVTMGCSDDAEEQAPAPTPLVTSEEVPDTLAATGLYLDIAAKTLSPRVRAFTPAAPLWSDGAEKDRWIDLPDGATIDTSDPDAWRFPVGTKAWKEFRVAGLRVETRFSWKVREDRWLFASYVWSEDGMTATRGEGTSVVRGGVTSKIPTTSECNDCHKGRRDRVLGFDAVGLGLDGASGLAALVAENRFTKPPSPVVIPDDGTGKAAPALAWLHANCGSCHNENPNATGYPIGLRLRLRTDELARPPASWQSIASTINVPAKNEDATRIVPGDPDASLLVARFSVDGALRMPPIGSNVVDADGVAKVRAWISAMPRPTAPVPVDPPPADPPAEPPADP